MTHYFRRLAQQSGLVPNRTSSPREVSDTTTLPLSTESMDVVELHEERVAPPVSLPSSDSEPSPENRRKTATKPEPAAPATEQPETSSAVPGSAPVESRRLPEQASRPTPIPDAPQPGTAESVQAKHLEVVRQVVDWISAAPPPALTGDRSETGETGIREIHQSMVPPQYDATFRNHARTVAEDKPSPATGTVTRRNHTTAEKEDDVFGTSAQTPSGMPPLRKSTQVQADDVSPTDVKAMPGESPSVSIGAIQVIVEAPPSKPPLRPRGPAPQAPSAKPSPSRLARHYLRPD